MILRIAELIEREAGYILLSLVVMICGMALLDGPARATAADRLITSALAIMARSMGSKKTPNA